MSCSLGQIQYRVNQASRSHQQGGNQLFSIEGIVELCYDRYMRLEINTEQCEFYTYTVISYFSAC